MQEHLVRTPQQMGNAIRRARRQSALNQKILGEQTNLRQATISDLEAGESGTQMRTLFAVLDALKLELVVRPRTRRSTRELGDIF